MKKFKVGDKVVRTGKDYGEAKKGGIYEVSEVSKNGDKWSYGINLDGHYNKNGEFEYEGNNFELYEENSMSDKGILTPLQAAEALLKGDELEVIISKSEEWQPLDKHQNSVSIKNLKRWKFRHKPKTVIINGVEVPAPLAREPNQEFIYFINLFKSRVYQLPIDKLTFNHKYYWATKEDAQKALDAMLIPFNQSNKGGN